MSAFGANVDGSYALGGWGSCFKDAVLYGGCTATNQMIYDYSKEIALIKPGALIIAGGAYPHMLMPGWEGDEMMRAMQWFKTDYPDQLITFLKVAIYGKVYPNAASQVQCTLMFQPEPGTPEYDVLEDFKPYNYCMAPGTEDDPTIRTAFSEHDNPEAPQMYQGLLTDVGVTYLTVKADEKWGETRKRFIRKYVTKWLTERNLPLDKLEKYIK
ncbi:hypothetical protein MA9V2_015 [Chryseobacterium phage MA9V-2]|nr:hypothetical protein MA9V2_015 [Chryseobacterium phage MA9V-2]